MKVGSLKEEDLHQDGEKGHREVLEHRGAERALLGTGGQDGWRGQAGRAGAHSMQRDRLLQCWGQNLSPHLWTLQPQASSLTLWL